MESQFVPLGVYTREVDYTDVDVQVNERGHHQGFSRFRLLSCEVRFKVNYNNEIFPTNTFRSTAMSHAFPYQVQIQETDALMKEQEFISGPLESWLSSFVEWAANNTEYRWKTDCR